jgi:hypothetical protein
MSPDGVTRPSSIASAAVFAVSAGTCCGALAFVLHGERSRYIQTTNVEILGKGEAAKEFVSTRGVRSNQSLYGGLNRKPLCC